MRRASLAFLVFVLAAFSVHAATFERVTDADLLNRADLVVVATVLDAAPRAGENGMIFTDYTLQVRDVLKGSASSTIKVSEAGGTIGDRFVFTSGSARYEKGADVITFLRTREDGSHFTAYMGLGIYRETENADGTRVAVRTAPDVELLEGETFDSRDAHDFVAAIRAGDPARAARIPQRQIQAEGIEGLQPAPEWTSGSYALTGSGPSGVLPIRWHCPSSEPAPERCPTPWKLDTTDQPGVSAELADASNAADVWTNEPNASIPVSVVQSPTDIANTDLSNSTNDIVLASNESSGYCDAAVGCNVGMGTTATHTFNGESWYAITQSDIIIRPSVNSSSMYKLVLAHEFGHGIGIRHSNQGSPSAADALMKSSVSGAASLKLWDQRAANNLYGNGTAYPCQAVMVTSHTPDATVPYGETRSLTVTVTGEDPFTYQWYEGFMPDTSKLVGDKTSFRTPPITETMHHWVRVSNCGGQYSSQPTATMITSAGPCIPASITTQPSSGRVAPETKMTLTVEAAGSATLEYQWYEGLSGDITKPIAGATRKSYTTDALSNGMSKNFWVRVKNDCGSVNSNTATVAWGNQCLPAAATPVAANVSAELGGTASLGVVATGDAPFAYQWYQGALGNESAPVAGATADSYLAGPFNTPGTFSYWVKVTNTCGIASVAVTVTVSCNATVAKPMVSVPATSLRSAGYTVSWTGDLSLSPTFELQEARDANFTTGLQSFTVSGAKSKAIAAHTEVTQDTRFYYRVRAISVCTQLPGEWSKTQSVLVTIPLPATARSFSLAVPVGATQPVQQPLFVEGYGASALPGDAYAVTTDAAWLTISPASGALPAAGVTVTMSAAPADLEAGTSSATVTITRTQGPGKFGTHGGSSNSTFPFSMSLVTPVSPDPRTSGAPPGTLIIPAVAHADGIGTRFQSDIRIANISSQDIEYELTYTPSQQNGLQSGIKTTLVIPGTDSRSFDDVVNNWFASGVAQDPNVFGTLEIRPMNAPDAYSTVASSRTYAIETNDLGEIVGTLGQFIPALGLDQFVASSGVDPLGKISLQQIAHSADYRTNVGLFEGTGNAVTALVKLLDGNNNLIASVSKDIAAYGHQQFNGLDSLFPGIGPLTDGRIEVEVSSLTGMASAYASVIDNYTADPLLVFPEQAGKISANTFVLPGISDGNFQSNFHSDTRIFNGGSSPVTVNIAFEPLNLFTNPPHPEAVQLVLNAGEVKTIDDTLPTLWGITQTAGALRITTEGNASLVATARTYSNVGEQGTNGQFIAAMTSAEAVGVGERQLTILQLENSPQYRSNVGLVEVTGQPVLVEISAYRPDSKLTAVTQMELDGNEYTQLNSVFSSFFGATTNIYGGRISLKVIGGTGRVAAYGSVVDINTSDPTYVPAQ